MSALCCETSTIALGASFLPPIGRRCTTCRCSAAPIGAVSPRGQPAPRPAVSARHEPDLETCARICSTLEIAADLLLDTEHAAAVRPVLGELLRSLNASDLATLSAVAEGLALRSGLRKRREREDPV